MINQIAGAMMSLILCLPIVLALLGAEIRRSWTQRKQLAKWMAENA